MRILGIDQGIAHLGYCVLEINGDKKTILEYGQLVTYPDGVEDNMCERIRYIVDTIIEICNEFKPDRLCCEKLFYNAPHGRNKSASIMSTNIASGLIMYAAGKSDVEFKEYPPTTVKNNITGNGKAEKDEVREGVYKIYPGIKWDDKFLSEHMIDAIAIATTSWIIDGETKSDDL